MFNSSLNHVQFQNVTRHVHTREELKKEIWKSFGRWSGDELMRRRTTTRRMRTSDVMFSTVTMETTWNDSPFDGRE